MATAKFAWGIDIGNRALKAIKLVREGDGFRIDDVDVIEHEQVLSNSGDNREGLIQTALANFAQRHDTKGGVVAIGVSGQASFARFIKLPPVEEKKIPEIVRFEAIQQIPFPLDQVEWSFQLFRQSDSPDVEVGIFAMRKELVNQQIKYFTDMDMNVQVVQMSPLAVYNAMHFDNRLADGTTMILDLGAENADLIIADGDSVWLRSVPIGGNNFTEALVKSFKLNFAKAEELKRNAQTSKYARQIFQAMRPIFADLVAEIQRSIGFYSSVHRDSRIKRIVALGNTFRLPTLQKYLHQNLQIDVDRLDGFTGGAPDDGRQAAVLSENIASMAGAYGLALQAMGQGKIASSLLPLEIKRAKIWREKTKWFALAASLFVAAAGVMYGTYYFHNNKFEAKKEVRTDIDATVARAGRLDGEWAQLEKFGGADKTRITNVYSLQQYRDLWADLWIDVTSALPDANGKTPDQIKSTPRAERPQVFIEHVGSRYVPDIGEALKAENEKFKLLATSATDILDPFAQQQNAGGARRTTDLKRGYLVTLQCTSPHKEASTLVESLIKDLLKRVSEEDSVDKRKNYYVARALIVSAQQINNDAARKTRLIAAHQEKLAARQKAEGPAQQPNEFARPAPANRPFGSPSPSFGQPAATGDGGDKAKAEAQAFVDPLFPEETVLNDWALTVLVAVVLDPKAPPANANPARTVSADPADVRRTTVFR